MLRPAQHMKENERNRDGQRVIPMLSALAPTTRCVCLSMYMYGRELSNFKSPSGVGGAQGELTS